MNKLPIELLKEINLIKDKKELIIEIDNFLSKNEKIKKKILKNEELKKKENLFLKPKKFYRDLIFFSKSKNILDEIDLELIFCNGNKELVDIWRYFKVMSSSAHTGDDSFGCIKIMLKDKISEKYLGILELGYDIFSCECRDNYIGWQSKNKKELVPIENNLTKNRLSFIINITCCIGLQPMAYNLNIGKLLVMSVFSKEIMDYFKKKRGYYFAGVSTFGLYGKSVQYDRLKEIKYIGETKGTGTCEIPISLYDKIRDYVKEYYEYEYIMKSNMSSSKMRILQFGLNILGYEQKDILNHGMKRGIYFGYTSNESKDFFNGIKDSFKIENIKSFNDIFNNWKNRWGLQRLNNVLLENKYKIFFDLKDFTQKEKKNEYSKQYNFNKSNIDKIWLKNKKENNKKYYYDNKDKILEEINVKTNNDHIFIEKEYLAGFFDSDGSIYISNDVLFVSFSQCVLNILLSIQNQYGGTLFKRNKKNENQRIQYTLRIVGQYTKKILLDLNETCVLKKNKVSKGIEYLDFINKKMNEEKQNIIDYIRNNKKEDNQENFNRINWKYVAGFFDGDGCITMNYIELERNKISSIFSIAQKYTPNFLNYLKVYISSNSLYKLTLSKHAISTSSKELISLIYEKIKNYLIVKKYQFYLLIKIIDENKKENKNFVKIKELAYEMKKNKHQNIEYEINIEKENIISNIKNIVLNELDEKNNDIIKNKISMSVILSEKKTGLNNPNYGKSLTENHALNISLQTSKVKRANNPNLSDEKIIEIYNLKNKMLQKDVAEKYNMNREMIRRIWNKLILPTNSPEYIEQKQEKINLLKTQQNTDNNITSQQKTSIGKRTLSVDEILEIIDWKLKDKNGEKLENKKIYSTNLADYLSKKWNKKVSNDIIKNIWIGKTKLFEFEFINKNITYQEYINIIEK
jgi:hypothetical protein